MRSGEHVNKYMLSMTIGSYGVKWTLALETEGGKHELALGGENDVDTVLKIVRGDKSVYFDPKTQTLSTGWNDPGT